MLTKKNLTTRIVVCTAVAALFAIAVAGCGKKQATQEKTTAQTTTTESAPATTPATPNLAGTYTAQLPAADTPGRKVSLVLGADHSATMSTDYMNNQPPATQSGKWELTEDGMLDVTFVSDSGDTTTMSFHPAGTELHMMNAEAAGYGDMGMTLTRQSAGGDGASSASSDSVPSGE